MTTQFFTILTRFLSNFSNSIANVRKSNKNFYRKTPRIIRQRLHTVCRQMLILRHKYYEERRHGGLNVRETYTQG